MTDKNLFIVFGIIALATLFLGLWPITLLIIIGMVILKLKSTKKQAEMKEPEPIQDKPVQKPTEQDVRELAYRVILRRVTEMVQSKYPEARWIWESPNIRQLLENGGEVFILLNRAGGFRRAKVNISGFSVTGIEYESAPMQDKKSTESEETTDDATQPENYGLIAFEWVAAHIMELNERCNEAIGNGMAELLIKADELPVPESWSDICRELERADICEVKCVSEGIKINLIR